MTQNALKDTSPQITEPKVSLELAKEYGLSNDEYDLILNRLDRDPTHTELGIFSVMWSEHCSYKTSRLHLKKLPTEAPWVIQGPGENAGVIDIGDNQAAIFKMESHNHPSYIEPYQGAATGVGGIMRDVFTMGARPIANINALRFGDPSHPKTRHLVSGVVAGIAGYGNCMGVPTVGGETQFDESYNGNILVNAMTVGIAEQDKIFYARGASIGQPVVYVGSKTGRDGIHGATMASAEFDDAAEEKRPTVQVGDPFTEKLLLEACLELMQKDVIVSIQDMGAAGLTSSSVEIADKGEIGVHLNLDLVPQREPNMTPYEIMLSESQERMLMILKPGHEDEARQIFEKWDLDFAVIGETIEQRHLILDMYGQRWCDIPVPPLVDDAPVYDRPYQEYKTEEVEIETIDDASQILEDLKKLIACPNMSSKRWIWEQYDSLVMGQTKASSGISGTQAGRASDAAIVKVSDNKALAISSDCNPHYCYADPFEGGKQNVAESYRNLCASGATPKAVTNNLNFGNPERPEIMHQFVGCVEGIAEACRVLDYPVISGNVSLYNETNGKGILPTPVIGGVGLLENSKSSMDIAFKNEGDAIFVIGQDENFSGHLQQSLYLREILGKKADQAGVPPYVNLKKEKSHGGFILNLIEQQQITACHDVSDGGLLCAIAEMCLAGHIGAELTIEENTAFWFGEDQARYIVSTDNPNILLEIAEKENIPVMQIGSVRGNDLVLSDHAKISLKELLQLHESWLPDYMS